MGVIVIALIYTFRAVWLLLARGAFVTAYDVIAGTGRRTITARCKYIQHNEIMYCVPFCVYI